MRTPGPDHPISVALHPHRIEVHLNGQVLVSTEKALAVQEADYPVVLYLPREDTDMRFLERTATTSVCPFKGETSYFSLVVNGETKKDAVWTYETPYPAVAPIKDHLAFSPDEVELREIGRS